MMMQSMRKMGQTWVFKALSLFLIVSFAIWGIGDMFRGNPQQRKVAKIGGQGITVIELERNFSMELPEARKEFGGELTEKQARRVGVLDRTLTSMIENSLLGQEAQRLGIEVDDKTMMEALAKQFPQAVGKNGKLDLNRLDKALAKSGLAREFFFANQRDEIARQLLVDAAAREVSTPKGMIEAMYRARGEKRVLDVVSLRDDSMGGVGEPDEKSLAEYYEKHNAGFALPEYRSVTAAFLTPESVKEDISISDEDLKKAYDERIADMSLPERRDLVQVVLQDEAAAKMISEAADAGKAGLEKAARAQGKTVVRLDKVDEKGVTPELYATVFALDEGHVSSPVKSAFGWHVVQVKKVYPAGTVPFSEAKAGLREALSGEKLSDSMGRSVNRLDDALAAGKSLEDIADGMKLRLVKVPAIGVNGRDKNGKEVTDAPSLETMVKAAFRQNSGETGQVIDDGQGGYMVVRTDEVFPARVPPLDEVKAKAAAAWKNEQRAAKAAKAIEEMANAMRDGKSTAQFALKSGVEVRTSKPISLLGDVDRDLPATAMPQIFGMKKGDVITVAANGKHYAMRIAALAQADPNKSGTSMVKIADAVGNEIKYDMLWQYSRHLRKRYPVETDDALLESLKGKDGEEQ